MEQSQSTDVIKWTSNSTNKKGVEKAISSKMKNEKKRRRTGGSWNKETPTFYDLNKRIKEKMIFLKLIADREANK